MVDWKSLQDDLGKWVNHGDVSHLPGAGEPLNLEDDSHIPTEFRVAHKIMKDNNVQPTWIMLGQELNEKRESILKQLRQGVRNYCGRLQDAQRANHPGAEIMVENDWQHTLSRLRNATDRYNKRILDFNLTAPQGIPHKLPIRFEKELEQLR